MEASSQSNAKQAKHQWAPLEDAKLVECLVELAATLWKCENGTFKPGYTKQLEQKIGEKIPGRGLKANPHIESRVKILKKHYFAIVEMMGASGFGWNDKDKTIVVEREIFKEWVKSHPNAAGLYNKPFPYFEELGTVFGKDRAQGANAEDPADAVAAMEAEVQTQVDQMQINEDVDARLNETEVEFESNDQDPHADSSIHVEANSSTGKKKRKRATKGSEMHDTLSETINKIGKMYEQTSSNILELASCFKHEKEGSERKMQFSGLLDDIDGLTQVQRVRAGIIITKESLTDYIFTLKPEDRLVFVLEILRQS